MRHWLRRLYFFASWPVLKVYFRRGPRARVLLTDPAGRLLLVRGRWQRWYDDAGLALPGGGIQPSESPVTAAVRELHEELDLKLPKTQCRLLGQVRLREYGLSYEAYLFHAVLSADTPFRVVPGELVTAAWYARTALGDQRLKPEVHQALALLARYG